jgi:hypothetical protein
MALKPELLTALMERAMEEELGLAVETNNPKQLQITLANHRNENGLDQFRGLLFNIPSVPNQIFITKKTVDLDDA